MRELLKALCSMEVPETRIAKAVMLQCIAANIGLDAECFHQLMRAAVLGSSHELAYVIYAETRPAYGVDNVNTVFVWHVYAL